jgi:peptidase M50B-like protein
VRYGTAGVERAVAYFVAWFLLFSGARTAFGNIGGPKKIKDAEVLANMTYLWEWVWCWLWLALTIAALAVGGRILIRGLGGL